MHLYIRFIRRIRPSNHQPHLLTESPWSHTEALEALSLKEGELFKEDQEVALLIDEVGFRKKGKHSACVSRQYPDCIGKQDNGQVAVVAGLPQGRHYPKGPKDSFGGCLSKGVPGTFGADWHCPIDGRLFMPESWHDDQQRRKKAKIPDQPTYSLNEYKSTLTLENDFEQIAFRDGTKQKIKAFFHQKSEGMPVALEGHPLG